MSCLRQPITSPKYPQPQALNRGQILPVRTAQWIHLWRVFPLFLQLPGPHKKAPLVSKTGFEK